MSFSSSALPTAAVRQEERQVDTPNSSGSFLALGEEKGIWECLADTCRGVSLEVGPWLGRRSRGLSDWQQNQASSSLRAKHLTQCCQPLPLLSTYCLLDAL